MPFIVYQAIVTIIVDTLHRIFIIITLWNTRRVHSIVGMAVHDKSIDDQQSLMDGLGDSCNS